MGKDIFIWNFTWKKQSERYWPKDLSMICTLEWRNDCGKRCDSEGMQNNGRILALWNWPTGSIKISWTHWILRDMSKSFAELLTPKIVIVDTKKIVNEQIMTQKTKKSSSGGQHSKLRTPSIWVLQSLKGPKLDPLNFWVRATPDAKASQVPYTISVLI